MCENKDDDDDDDEITIIIVVCSLVMFLKKNLQQCRQTCESRLDEVPNTELRNTNIFPAEIRTACSRC